MPLLNNFLLGADPEFAILEDGHLRQFQGAVDRYAPWGLDHGNWVMELHPKPEFSVRQMIANLKVSFNDFAIAAPLGKWRAGARVAAPERVVTLGGHVHVDQPSCSGSQAAALDLFTQHLERLDILPRVECEERRTSHYGRYGDIRVEHGHFEYRTFPSWLFSQRVTKLCFTGTKLAIIDPTGPAETLGSPDRASIPLLKSFFERFQHRDDDVDWLLASSLFERKLNVRPDRDLRDVWKVQPAKEDPHWKEAEARAQLARAQFTRAVDVEGSRERINAYVFEVDGTYLSFERQPNRIPTTAEFEQIMEDRPTAWHRLVPGIWETELGLRLVVQGKREESWATEIRTLSYRTSVAGQVYTWRVLADQNPTVYQRMMLRGYIQSGSAQRGVLVLRDGFLFQLESEPPL